MGLALAFIVLLAGLGTVGALIAIARLPPAEKR